ncbi:Fungal specific transcription factor domain-containing protein [Cladophialophora immunda]|nr:Fungal specific transcription factor domain-containing protein [Cladophialophora immunda]
MPPPDESYLKTPRSLAQGQAVTVDDDGLPDVLATATFSDMPDADMGYFGPSSNHFLFRSLTDVFVKISRIFVVGEVQSHEQPPIIPQRQTSESAPAHTDLRKTSDRDYRPDGGGICYALPRYQDAILLINHYFATVGLVLPYVDKAALVSQYLQASGQRPPHFRRGFFALISIVWALALNSLGNPQAETYYQRALTVLNPRCLRGSSLEIVQALLLIIAYQQNSQRSISSWTTHALAVKAAIQHGLHSPTTRSGQVQTTGDLMERLWAGIVFNDGILGSALGRPGLVHPRFLRSSSTLLASIIEVMYNDNIGLSEPRSVSESLHDYGLLMGRLQEWREGLDHFGGLASSGDLKPLANCSLEPLRLRILLSIHYYRLYFMISWPVLIALVGMLVEDQINSSPERSDLWNDLAVVAKSDWKVANELNEVINTITACTEPFLHSNAAWFTCNYTSLTVCLHVFVLLLACSQDKDNNLGFSMLEARSAIESSLNNLKLLERTSLMSYKARRCLLKLMGAFDALLEQERDSPLRLASDGDMDVPEFIQSSANEFLFETSLDDFLNSDVGSYSDDNWFGST